MLRKYEKEKQTIPERFRTFVWFRNFVVNDGFTLIELLVVVFIVGLLSSIVTVNFRAQRIGQEVQVAGRDLISSLREIQNQILAGREVAGGQAPTAYELTFMTGSQSYTVDYYLGAIKTSYQTVQLSPNIEVRQLYRGSTAEPQLRLRFEAPYGKITVDNQAHEIAEIVLGYKTENRTTSVVVDGISGRIGLK